MSLFKFNDTKMFLRHYLAQLPKKGRGEISKIAKELRVSTTLVSQVLSGNKSFTLEQAQSLCTYLGLTGIDAEYFMLLVLSDRAGSMRLKKMWFEKIEKIREQSLQLATRVKADRVLTDHERAVFYSSPLYAAIQMYTSVGAKGKSLEEICTRFEISRIQAAEMMKFLVNAGLCAEEADRFKIGIQKTHLGHGSPFLPRHHANWRIRAIQRSENLGDGELMYTVPVSLSKKDFSELREEMAEFIKKFLDKVHASDAEEIACLNLDWFWIKK